MTQAVKVCVPKKSFETGLIPVVPYFLVLIMFKVDFILYILYELISRYV